MRTQEVATDVASNFGRQLHYSSLAHLPKKSAVIVEAGFETQTVSKSETRYKATKCL